jgi:hypothetical protein
VQLGHFVPPYRGIAVEELYHDLSIFQLETVHFSALNGSLFIFKPQLGLMAIDKKGTNGYNEDRFAKYVQDHPTGPDRAPVIGAVPVVQGSKANRSTWLDMRIIAQRRVAT